MPPVRITKVMPIAMTPTIALCSATFVRFAAVAKYGVAIQRPTLSTSNPSAVPASRPATMRRSVVREIIASHSHRARHHILRCRIGASEFTGNPPFTHDQDAIGQPKHFGQI